MLPCGLFLGRAAGACAGGSCGRDSALCEGWASPWGGQAAGHSARPPDDLADIGLGSDSVCARPSSHRIKSFDSLGSQPAHGRTSQLFQGQYRSLVSVGVGSGGGGVAGGRGSGGAWHGAAAWAALPLLSGLAFATARLSQVSLHVGLFQDVHPFIWRDVGFVHPLIWRDVGFEMFSSSLAWYCLSCCTRNQKLRRKNPCLVLG